MNNGHSEIPDLDPSFVRAQFDEILAEEITSLIQIDSDLALLSYNLATLSCIILSVEREREIKQFIDSPPERYDRESFLVELEEIGLDQDETLLKAVDSVIEMGYVRENADGTLQAEVSAYTMVGFLDTMFPGMQGMNLIAFVLQMNDEVLGGRKTLETAKANFAQTLKTRGVAVTKAKAEEKATQIAAGRETLKKPSKEVADRLKEANLRRIATLRKKRAGGKPSFHTSAGHDAERITVRDVFAKGPSKEELEALQRQKEKAEQEAIQAKLTEGEEKIRQAEEKARELAEKEQELKAAREAVAEAERKARELLEKEAEMAAREAELKAMEERLAATQKDREEDRQRSTEKEVSEEDIESRIAAFEAELGMPCPLCADGTVTTEQTPKGKTYYTCSNADCRFVSWQKPYHFACPLCKNPFLEERMTPSGKPGLACPRASCSYTRDDLSDPALSQVEDRSRQDRPRKKKKLVRRVRKKR